MSLRRTSLQRLTEIGFYDLSGKDAFWRGIIWKVRSCGRARRPKVGLLSCPRAFLLPRHFHFLTKPFLTPSHFPQRSGTTSFVFKNWHFHTIFFYSLVYIKVLFFSSCFYTSSSLKAWPFFE